MTQILDYRQAVIDKIRAAVTDARSVEPHGGAFNVETLQRVIADSPAVYVAILGAKKGNLYSTGQISVTAEVACVIVSRNIGQQDADEISWGIGEQIFKLARWNRFGLTGVMPPEDVIIENLWTDKADSQGFSLNIVAWAVEVLIGEDEFFGEEFAPADANFQFPSVLTVNEQSTPSAPAIPQPWGPQPDPTP